MLLIEKGVKEILSTILGCSLDTVSNDTLLADIGFDSLKFISTIVTIESKYGIEILDSDLDFDNFKNISAICATLKKYFDCNDRKLYKCIITDCDGVLWHGISGEAGDDGAYCDDSTTEFDRLLRELREKGVLLAICSKNEYKNIASMLDTTILSLDDFAIIETDVLNKADSVSYILSEFGFLAANAIYVDDSDAELEYMKSKHPKLTLIKASYIEDFIQRITELFADWPVSKAIDRTVKFREQKEREKVHRGTSSPEEYNRILETKTICGKATIDDIPRMTELSQRANRFNLTGSRYNDSDIKHMLNNEEYTIYILNASDIFGDMGLVAMAVLHKNTIESFIMSCRVFGRGFENELLTQIIENYNVSIKGLYHPTGKNECCRDFYLSCGVTYELF